MQVDCSWPENLAPQQLEGLPRPDRVQRQGQRLLHAQAQLDGLADSFQLHCMLIDDAEMQILNARTRGKDQPTDVLSFPLVPFPVGPGSSQLPAAQNQARTRPESISVCQALDWEARDMLMPPAGSLIELGDLVISYETCRRQAVQIGHSVADEFWRLFIHGLLHLFGYDHETGPADQARMQAREDQLWQGLSES